jgi:peptidoglycan/LPS O-acetylase OafA/YrhL
VTGYRPWLDGVRAVAVVAVVAQHTTGASGVDLSSGGVGLFFALSGYLITSLLLDERSLRGAVSLRRFYLRRTARLVPALLAVVVVCDLVFASQGDWEPVVGSIAAVTYTANYATVLDPGFVRGFGPTWSLAVEEHFYLLWPLFLLGITRRFGLRAALGATLAVCVAAVLWRTTLAMLQVPTRVLALGSFERADALLFGCAAAIALRLGWRPRPWLLWAGIGALAVMPFVFPHETYPAVVVGSAAIAIFGAALVVGLDYGAPAWIRRGLSLKPVVTLGTLSYGIYLWHGPLMRIADGYGFSGRGWRSVAALVSVGAASVSYRYLEVPIRAAARARTGLRGPEPGTPALGGGSPVAAGLLRAG